ncbi:hypothetical protein D9M69_630240 [compost metagenome]
MRFVRHPALAIEHRADGLPDGVRIGRLRNEAQRTVVERAAHDRRLFPRRHDDHRQLRVQCAQVHQRVEAVRAGHVEVHQQQIGIRVRIDQHVQRVHTVGFMQFHAGHHPLHGAAQRLTEQRVVVGDQQGGHGSAIHRDGKG